MSVRLVRSFYFGSTIYPIAYAVWRLWKDCCMTPAVIHVLFVLAQGQRIAPTHLQAFPGLKGLESWPKSVFHQRGWKRKTHWGRWCIRHKTSCTWHISSGTHLESGVYTMLSHERSLILLCDKYQCGKPTLFHMDASSVTTKLKISKFSRYDFCFHRPTKNWHLLGKKTGETRGENPT